MYSLLQIQDGSGNPTKQLRAENCSFGKSTSFRLFSNSCVNCVAGLGNRHLKLQCVRKVAVHLGEWVAISRRRIVGPWTSLPTPFISEQRFSERNLQKVFANKIKRVQACIDAGGHHF
jgi:hypothetical protein